MHCEIVYEALVEKFRLNHQTLHHPVQLTILLPWTFPALLAGAFVQNLPSKAPEPLTRITASALGAIGVAAAQIVYLLSMSNTSCHRFSLIVDVTVHVVGKLE